MKLLSRYKTLFTACVVTVSVVALQQCNWSKYPNNANHTLNKDSGRELLSASSAKSYIEHSKPAIPISQQNFFSNPQRFRLDPSFRVPWPRSKSVESIQMQPWFEELKAFLSNSVPNSPIVIVSTDGSFQVPLLNWLVSAKLNPANPVQNILVLTYNYGVYEFINSKKIVKCIAIPAESLTSPAMYMDLKRTGFYKLLVIRVTVLRLLNHWGYDVANFDTDAILLRNPVPLFYSPEYLDSDIVGTFGGGWPQELHDKWGVVVCMGAIFLRSTPLTEALWQSMDGINDHDDQLKLNYGLDKLNVNWTTKSDSASNNLSTVWIGKTEKVNLKVTLLPQNIACRGTTCAAETRKSAYIWHHGNIGNNFKQMIPKAIRDGVWFLKSEWNKAAMYIGVDWLKQISTIS